MLAGTLRDIASLQAEEKDRMHDIMVRHYADVHRDAFQHDLAEKDGVILLSDEADRIQGFSTYLFMHTEYRDDPIVALFSGDTIVDREFWGSPALFNTFGRLLFKLMHDNPGKKAYWFLITKGYRTYLMLPLFFNVFYPRHDMETPAYEAGLIEHLANMKYNGQFDASRGIIAADSYYLKGELAEVPGRQCRNQNVVFFLEKNPGYRRGDELACVCEISQESFRRRTRSLVRP